MSLAKVLMLIFWWEEYFKSAQGEYLEISGVSKLNRSNHIYVQKYQTEQKGNVVKRNCGWLLQRSKESASRVVNRAMQNQPLVESTK